MLITKRKDAFKILFQKIYRFTKVKVTKEGLYLV